MTDHDHDTLRAEILMLQEKVASLEANQQRDTILAQTSARQLNQFKAMLDVVPVGVVLTNNNGQVVLGNGAVEKLLRHPVIHSEDVAAYDAWVSFHKDGRRVESHEYPIARIISGEDNKSELNVHYQRGDDSLFWLRIIAEAVLDGDGQQIGAVAALIDIDQEQKLTAHQDILIGELNHRVKNAFSVFKSIVSQSLRKDEIPKGVRKTIDERLSAYAEAHAKLLGSDWTETDLATMVQDVVVKMAGERVKFGGPDVSFPSREALAISMAFYELCVNAVKYGALSTPDGCVDLSWHIETENDRAHLFINWAERDGPQTVDPMNTGFGSFIIDRAVSMETAGEVQMTFKAEGFAWQLRMPLNP